jgi:hypothetical protein
MPVLALPPDLLAHLRLPELLAIPWSLGAEGIVSQPPPTVGFDIRMEGYAVTIEASLKSLLEIASNGADIEALLRFVRALQRQDRDREPDLRNLLKQSHRQARDMMKIPHRDRGGSPLTLEDLRSISTQISRALPLQLKVTASLESCLKQLSRLRSQRLSAYRSEWANYLAALSLSSPALAEDATLLWSRYESYLWPPEASLTEDKGLLMVWDLDQHHLQIEVFSNGSYDWFYRDRGKAGYQSEEDLPVGLDSKPLGAVMKKFRRIKDRNG